MPKSVELDDDKLFALPLPYVCPGKWKNMKGDELVRECAVCKTNVYNVSKLNRQQSIDLISEAEGPLELRFFQRPDGTVITRDCAVRLGIWRLRGKWNRFALINACAAGVLMVLVIMMGPAMLFIIPPCCFEIDTYFPKQKQMSGKYEPSITLPPEPSAAEIEQGREGLE